VDWMAATATKAAELKKARQYTGRIPAKGIRRKFRQGPPQGYDAQDVTQGNGLDLVAWVFATTPQV